MSVMKKIYSFFLCVVLLTTVSQLSSCSKSSDSPSNSSTNLGAQAAGTYTGNELTWWTGNTKKYEGPATIKITDLGSNKIRVESAEPNKYNFPIKEFKIQIVDATILTASGENVSSNNIMLSTKTTPLQITYTINFNGELVTFDGLKN